MTAGLAFTFFSWESTHLTRQITVRITSDKIIRVYYLHYRWRYSRVADYPFQYRLLAVEYGPSGCVFPSLIIWIPLKNTFIYQNAGYTHLHINDSPASIVADSYST